MIERRPAAAAPGPERSSVISRLGSGGAWEELYGYSRVVRTDPWVLTAGCTATVDGVVKHVGDAYAQAVLAFEIALETAGAYGVTAENVARTRMYVVGAGNADAVGRAHGSVFGAVRPVSTLVLVAGLLHPDMLVEVEVEAYLP
jgi:enamine deaminase RidA (YjgF/YER057c/UK114 family)